MMKQKRKQQYSELSFLHDCLHRKSAWFRFPAHPPPAASPDTRRKRFLFSEKRRQPRAFAVLTAFRASCTLLSWIPASFLELLPAPRHPIWRNTSQCSSILLTRLPKFPKSSSKIVRFSGIFPFCKSLSAFAEFSLRTAKTQCPLIN